MSLLFVSSIFIVSLSACSPSKKSGNDSKRGTATESEKPFTNKSAVPRSEPVAVSRKANTRTPSMNPSNTTAEKSLGSLQFKYAILLDVPIEEIEDQKLFSFIDSWYGTPYRYGGFSKDGVDCSGFTQSFMTTIYNISIPRISAEQYNQSKRISRKELEQGDLVFFKTSGRTVSHVGIYLTNNKFVHASTSNGVMISDLDEDYYSRRFAGSGRVR